MISAPFITGLVSFSNHLTGWRWAVVRALLCVAAIGACGGAGARAGEFVAAAPEDLMFYQVFIDRFSDGDPANNGANPKSTFAPSSPTGFHGGDLEGVRQKLPYIQAMGFNAIWLSPFLENVNDYHGYGAFNWYAVDPNFGDLAALQRLVDEANALGIAVFYDMVAGHCSNLISSADPGYPGYRPPPGEYALRYHSALRYPPPFDSLDSFHAHGNIGNYSDPEQQLGELMGLDDLKTETPYVREEMLKIWAYWVENTGVSGFRIDTVKHVDMGFWEYFLPRLREAAAAAGRGPLFTFGEIFGADDNSMKVYVGDFQGAAYKLDAALDFQYYYTAQGVFARADSPPAWMAWRLEARARALGAHHLLTPNFFDNHDVRRFLNVARDRPGAGLAERLRRLDQALVFLFTAPGPPIVYYGTEQDFDGGGDPYNREDLFAGQFESGPSAGDNFDPAAPRYQLIQRLSALRTGQAPLRRGSFVVRAADTERAGRLVFSRVYEGEEVIVILNTSTSSVTQDAFDTTWPEGQALTNALGAGGPITIGPGGRFPARALAPQAAEIWVREGEAPPPGPRVLAFEPADGEVDVAPDSLVRIHFSTAMNEASVLAALSIAPAFSFSAEWSSTSTLLTLQPGAPLEPRTTYQIAVAASALSAAGEPLEFAAAASWKTARAETPLPPLPAPFPPLVRANTPILIDGDGGEWSAPGWDAMARDSGAITENSVFVWKDALDDDTGPGTYVYPTNTAFTGHDADIEEFRVALGADSLFFYFRPAAVNPEAPFFTPYFGVAMDFGEGGRTSALGYDQSLGAPGITELRARPDAAPEYELVFTGPRGATLLGPEGGVLAEIPAAAYNPQTGAVEIAVGRALLGLPSPLRGQAMNLVVYAALETYGGVREIEPAAGTWTPGGGIAGMNDPDVFDLAGAPLALQQADLADFDADYQTRVLHSLIALRLWDEPPPAASTLLIIR